MTTKRPVLLCAFFQTVLDAPVPSFHLYGRIELEFVSAEILSVVHVDVVTGHARKHRVVLRPFGVLLRGNGHRGEQHRKHEQWNMHGIASVANAFRLFDRNRTYRNSACTFFQSVVSQIALTNHPTGVAASGARHHSTPSTWNADRGRLVSKNAGLSLA
jgi:hypothetical protein